MVQDKEMEDHFGEVVVGETDDIQGTVVDTSRSTTIFRYISFNVHLLWMEEGRFLEFHPL